MDTNGESLPALDGAVEVYCELAKRGEPPSIPEFARNYPELAEELLELLPTLALLAKAGESRGPPLPALPEGRLGDFRIVREVGRGGMGVVFEAVQESLGRRVALKVLPVQATLDRQFLERFYREAKAAGRLQHPSIVPVFGGGEADGIHYYTMQFVDGAGLDQVLRAVRRCWDDPDEESFSAGKAELRAIVTGLLTGTFGAAETPPRVDARSRTHYHRAVARIGLQVARALGHAHGQGILHRDIKPSNLLLDTRGDAWVTDFGLCKAKESDDLTLSGDVLGTMRYMAPERFSRRSDARSDVYGLGITLYELLTLEPAFAESDPARLAAAVTRCSLPRPGTVRRGIAPDLETIVMKAIRREPEERYPTAMALAEDLQAFLEGRPIRAQPPSLAYLARLAILRNRVLSGAIAVTAILLLTASAIFVAQLDIARRRAEGAQEVSQFRSYVASISAAEAALRGGDVAHARQHLEEVPADRRNWEWHNLLSRLDLSSRTFVFEAGSSSSTPWNQAVRAVAYSPDGTRFAVGAERAIEVYDSSSGRRLAAVETPGSPVTSLAWTTGGETILSGGSWDEQVAVWRAEDLEQIAALVHDEAVRPVAVSADGSWIATGTTSGNVILWDAATLEPVGDLEGHASQITNLAFDHSGSRLATASSDETCRVWDVDSRSPIVELRGHRDEVTCVAWAPGGLRLVTGSMDGTLRTWVASSGTQLEILWGHGNGVRGVVWGPAGEWIASAAVDASVKLWDPGTGLEIANFHGHASSVEALAVSPDGLRLLSGSDDFTAKEWEVHTPEAPLTLRAHFADVSSLAFHPDGRILGTVGRDQTVRLWDLDTGEEVRTLTGGPTTNRGIDFSGDGRWLAWGSNRGTASLWDLESGALRAVLGNGTERVLSLAFDRQSRWLCVGSQDGRAEVWDVGTAELVRTLDAGGGGILCVAFDTDGLRLAFGTADGRVHLWNTTTWERSRVLDAHEDQVTATAFSQDGTHLATASLDHTAKLWDWTTGEEVGRLMGHSRGVTGVSFSPDGSRLATSSRSGAIKLWDTASNLEVATLRAHDDWASEVRFSPDGVRIATCSSDSTIKVWSTASPVGRAGRVAEAKAARDAARPLVEALFDGLDSVEAVVARLEEDDTLEPAVVEAARRLAHSRSGQPEELCRLAWGIVRDSENSPDEFERAAAIGFCLATKHDPSSGRYQLLHGAARYRVGKHDALEALLRAERLGVGDDPGSRAANLAFLAMAHAGRAASNDDGENHILAALETLRRLEGVILAWPRATEEARSLLMEARGIVEPGGGG